MDEQTINLRPPVWLPIVVALIAGGMYMGGKVIENRDPTPTLINVNGEGKVFAAPDIAQLTFGVQTGPQKTSKAAIQMLDRDMKAIIAAVKELGVEDKDIRTQQFWMNPVYDYNEGRQTLRGYEANQSLMVKVRDLDKVGDILTAAANAGANQVGGVSFTIDDPEELRAQARQEAINDAEAKAGKLADELGMRLGKLKGYSEGGGGYPPPVPYMAREIGGGVAADMAMEEKGLAIPEGEQEVIVTVALVYELK
ncbi:SIMPL domain-containing protein [Candidatus Peregrinibacteria bacterium]|nr:SIMPL domain-containing protein [Candidatus Peregrinibacteria bacterium]